MMKNKARWIWGGIVFSIILLMILIFLFRTPMLMRAGQFMAPRGDYFADAAILEGHEFLDRNIAIQGMKLLSSGKVKKIIVVLHRIAPSDRPFAFNEDYVSLVRKEMESLGLGEKDFRIVVVHIHHPITLVAAKGAMETIAKDNIKSVILLSPGFHARRSYLIYQHVCMPYQIRIFPLACFDSYQPGHWWSQDNGMRDFSMEFLKLAYYLARGYIPWKFSY